jgi:hypothetical protein
MKSLTLASLLLTVSLSIFAQDDLMNLINQSNKEEINFTSATFKSTHIMNGHSIEKMAPKQLDFRISHRFGRLNSGAYEFFGLDQANIHLSLEYGINKWLMAGIGRGTYEKTFDAFAKFAILRQSTGAREMPIAVSVFTSASLKTLKWPDPARPFDFSSRLSYVGQVLIARKFNQSFSAQITPTFVHRNLTATASDPNDQFALGLGGRMKLTKRISFNAEYYLIPESHTYTALKGYSPLSVGVDIETGGHVFQLIFTNSVAMIEKGFIGETTGSWGKGDIHFGFNISRVFNFNKEGKI